MNTPALIFLAITIFDLGASAARHGQPHKYPVNFWTGLIVNGLMMVLLLWAIGWGLT